MNQRTIVLLAALCLCGAARAAEKEEGDMAERGFEPIESSYGSMRAGLTIQTGFDVMIDQVEGERNSFALQRARLRLDGHLVSKDLTYLFEGDAVAGLGLDVRPGAPGSEMRPASSGQEVPFVLDAVVGWRLPKIGLRFAIGRFIPKWGLTMPEKVSRLGAINYPLYVHGAKGALGPFRDVGLEAEVEIHDAVRAGGGIFNGGFNSWLDDNDRKDLLVYFTFDPVGGLRVRASSLFKFKDVVDGIDELGEPITGGSETHLVPCVEARYRDFGLDLMLGAAVSIALRDQDDVREDYESYGFMGHAGYLFVGDWLELMARLEWWEPDSGAGDDEQWRITAGPQFHIDGVHMKVSINYIQDIFASARAMCETYLGLDNCEDLGQVPEAKKTAGTVLLQIGLDI